MQFYFELDGKWWVLRNAEGRELRVLALANYDYTAALNQFITHCKKWTKDPVISCWESHVNPQNVEMKFDEIPF